MKQMASLLYGIRSLLILIILAVVGVFAIGDSPALAQEFVFDNGVNNSFIAPQVIESPQKETYIFGMMTAGGDKLDFYAFDFNKTSTLVVELMIPEAQSSTHFRPSLIVVDENLSRIMGEAPFGFPPEVGGRVFDWVVVGETAVEDEGAFGTYIQGPRVVKGVAGKRQAIGVFDPDGDGGRYVIKIHGEAPADSFLSILKRLWVLLRVKFKLY